MTFVKGQKPPKKGEKISKISMGKVENVGITVVENEISNEVEAELVNIQHEVKNEQIEMVEKPKKKKMSDRVMGVVGASTVVKPQGRIKFEAQVAPVPLFKLPADIRQYLINNGFTSDVYKENKEWLEKHNADMEMIEKLKAFITNM